MDDASEEDKRQETLDCPKTTGRKSHARKSTRPEEADRRPGNTCSTLLQETAPAEREALLTGHMANSGLIRWRTCWVTPERAEELEVGYQEGVARARQETERMRAARAKFRHGSGARSSDSLESGESTNRRAVRVSTIRGRVDCMIDGGRQS